MKFQKGNQLGKVKTGKKYPRIKATLTKIQLRDLNTIDDLTRKTLENLNEGLDSPDMEVRISTAVSIAKFLFPTKRESINLNAGVEEYLRMIEKGEDPFRLPAQTTALMVIPQNQPENATSNTSNVAP